MLLLFAYPLALLLKIVSVPFTNIVENKGDINSQPSFDVSDIDCKLSLNFKPIKFGPTPEFVTGFEITDQCDALCIGVGNNGADVILYISMLLVLCQDFRLFKLPLNHMFPNVVCIYLTPPGPLTPTR